MTFYMHIRSEKCLKNVYIKACQILFEFWYIKIRLLFSQDSSLHRLTLISSRKLRFLCCKLCAEYLINRFNHYDPLIYLQRKAFTKGCHLFDFNIFIVEYEAVGSGTDSFNHIKIPLKRLHFIFIFERGSSNQFWWKCNWLTMFDIYFFY